MKIRVICPRCSTWREEDEKDVDPHLVEACVADSNPIPLDCEGRADERFQAQLLQESMHPEWGL